MAVSTPPRKAAKPGWHSLTATGFRPQVAEVQRSRLMVAAIRAVEELGYSNISVAHITARARVSRRTFYELFADREECLTAALLDAVGRIERELDAGALDGLAWRERIRMGLWRILSFLDREPVLARVCVVESLRGGPEVLRSREALLARLASVVDEGRSESASAARCSPLVAEGLVGAAFSIVYARVLRSEPQRLVDLVGEMSALIVLPYLGQAAAARERTRPAPVSPLRGERPLQETELPGADPLVGAPIRLTYRTARVLVCVGAHPGASNRQIGDHAGVSDQGQMSKLLARLERVGLLLNAGKHRPKGEANAWELTVAGRQLAQVVAGTTNDRGETGQ